MTVRATTELEKASERMSEQGYLVHRGLYLARELARVRQLAHQSALAGTCLWQKDLAASSAPIARLATQASIVDRLRPVLGPDIVLWGASYVRREPGQVHCWHTDIESVRPEGGFVSLWIGVEGTAQSSAPKLVPGSHRFGSTLQRVAHDHGADRETTSDDDVVWWARVLDPGSPGVVQPDVRDGDAIFFDGRLWHGSANIGTHRARGALLFQYAAADVPVHIPDLRHLAWPHRLIERPRPPCIRVCGQADESVNALVDAPPDFAPAEAAVAPSRYDVDLELPIEPGRIIRQQPLFAGRSPHLAIIRSHYSVLAPDQSPHPLHGHVDEEILIVLRGRAKLLFEDESGAIGHRIATRGDAVYYPAFHPHTVCNAGREPIVYLMFKWVAPRSGASDPIDLQHFSHEVVPASSDATSGFEPRELFAGPTHHLARLQVHDSTLEPGGGYAPHADEHDVALVVFEGEIESIDQRVGPGGLLWLPAGSLHGMYNPGESTARYLVVEFHGASALTDAALDGAPRTRQGWRRAEHWRPQGLVADVKRLFVPARWAGRDIDCG